MREKVNRPNTVSTKVSDTELEVITESFDQSDYSFMSDFYRHRLIHCSVLEKEVKSLNTEKDKMRKELDDLYSKLPSGFWFCCGVVATGITTFLVMWLF